MKNRYYITIGSFIISLVLISCSEPEIRIIDEEIPDNIITTEFSTETLQDIKEMFPEKKDARLKYPELFDVNNEKRIVLINPSEVYVTFIAEGASYQNSFGYYTYNLNSTPTDYTSLKLHILFPNVDGTKLKQGDMLQLSSDVFPAGTVIGFFMIINGWESHSVHYDREKIFTDLAFNSQNGQQHVLFKLKNFGDVILCFEDILNSSSRDHDYDYNDIIFTVSDNRNKFEVTNFKIEDIVKL